jgi:spore coat protein CotH
MGDERKIAKEYDRDGNEILDAAERAAARKALRAERSDRESRGGGAPRRGGFWSSGRDDREPPARGIPLSPADVPAVPESVGLYDPTVLRTLFFEFESEDWEAELSDFARTDVEVPATLRVDGKAYPGVGVGFRGASSLFTVGPGYKRSLNVSIDAAFKDQRLLGYKTLNLLNGHSDPSFLHAMLFSHVARKYGAAPKVNLVRVVINGENWGIYVNAQQFDRIMIAENFPEADGARWKVPGSPRGRGGLEYLGTDLDEYERRFELKAGGKKAWPRLVRLCQALNETPAAELGTRCRPCSTSTARSGFSQWTSSS